MLFEPADMNVVSFLWQSCFIFCQTSNFSVFSTIFSFPFPRLRRARQQNANVWNWEDRLRSYKKDIPQMKMPPASAKSRETLLLQSRPDEGEL